jgi:hypothetical protein
MAFLVVIGAAVVGVEPLARLGFLGLQFARDGMQPRLPMRWIRLRGGCSSMWQYFATVFSLTNLLVPVPGRHGISMLFEIIE